MPPLPALLGIARGPFLLLSLNTVLLAVALAWPSHGMNAGFLGEALLVLVAAVAAHVSVNAFNEHHDFRSGLDLSTQRTPFSGGSGTLPGNPQLLGAALWRITPFSPLEAAAMALLVTVVGFLGGLVMSAIKRDRGIKDWGQLLEGHGGMLDRLDSVCFSAPIFFHVTRYFFAL